MHNSDLESFLSRHSLILLFFSIYQFGGVLGKKMGSFQLLFTFEILDAH